MIEENSFVAELEGEKRGSQNMKRACAFEQKKFLLLRNCDEFFAPFLQPKIFFFYFTNVAHG